MPKLPTENRVNIPALYIGIDPGVNGGLVALYSSGKIEYEPMPSTERDIVEWFRSLPTGPHTRQAMIEQQIPRPTKFMVNGKWVSSILKSTCLLYGSYLFLRGVIASLGISLQEETPQVWQKALGLSRKKEMTDSKWKDSLRGKAQQFHPSLDLWSQKNTKGKQLAIADALLIATYLQRQSEGKL